MGCHFLLQFVSLYFKGGNGDSARLKLLCGSVLSHVRVFANPWTLAYQAPLSMGFSRQQYWSGLPFPSPGNLPDPGIKPRSPALQTDALPPEPPGKSILKEISPEYSLEGLILKLELQYFGHLMRRADLFEKTLMLGKIEGRKRRGRQ